MAVFRPPLIRQWLKAPSGGRGPHRTRRPLRHGRHGQRQHGRARGKIYHAEERGEPVPEVWAADADGVPTTDPRRAVEGLILPMAGHKGYAISFTNMCTYWAAG